MRRIHGALWWGCGLILIVLQTAPSGHTPIASRWNFNEHLFPIFRDRCGSCHIEGGVGPMSLVQYRAAYPWAQAIREEVLSLRMPPWQAEDGFGTFRNGDVLTAREMDMILEWSSGGYPEGPRNRRPAAPILSDDWPLGPPALTVEMPETFTLAADTNEAVRYFVIAPGIVEDRIVTGFDFRPGAPAIVRSAAVFVDAKGTAGTLDAADAVWYVGQRMPGTFNTLISLSGDPYEMTAIVRPSLGCDGHVTANGTGPRRFVSLA